MKIKSIIALGTAIATSSAAIIIAQRYLQWKRQQRERLPSASRLLETPRGTVEYQLEGDGPVVLLLHGSPGGYDQGIAIVHSLDLHGFTWLSLSRPGYRRTPLSSGETPEAQADLYAAALDALHISQVAIMALSGGGPSALQFVLRYPERCRELLMLCALSQHYTEEEVYRSIPPGKRLVKRITDGMIDFDPLIFLLYKLSQRIPSEARAGEFIESLAMNSRRTPGFQNDMQQFASLPPVPVQDIAIPTLIVHGTGDEEIPFRQAQELAEAIPGAQLVAIAGANHLTALGREEAITAISSFLQQLYTSEAKRG
jgi:pimeloyl-ACP methyl ester carboxylesterase